MNKILRAIKGFLLFRRHVYVFELSGFAGKRIAIVGPASSAYEQEKGEYIDGFDLVVRVNKSVLLVDKADKANYIGHRTDLLFHCFLENMYSGGGPLDFGLYKRQGIQKVINPRNEFSGKRNTFNFYKKYLAPRPTYLLPASVFSQIKASLGGQWRPTTGYSALCTLLMSDFAELYITGFTFFKTPYGGGYRDEMQSAEKAKAFMDEAGWHNPDAEFEAFCRLYKANRHKNIILDDTLKALVEEHG